MALVTVIALGVKILIFYLKITLVMQPVKKVSSMMNRESATTVMSLV